jgi:hypothetical protein
MAGAHTVLPKPVDPHQLFTLMASIIVKSTTEEPHLVTSRRGLP